jgi:hypothetical protein
MFFHVLCSVEYVNRNPELDARIQTPEPEAPNFEPETLNLEHEIQSTLGGA